MFSLLILAAVRVATALLAGPAHRGILSTAVLFLIAAFVVGRRSLGGMTLQPRNVLVSYLTEPSLYGGLLVDAVRMNFGALRRGWRLAVRVTDARVVAWHGPNATRPS
jgi:hypothetical protein